MKQDIAIQSNQTKPEERQSARTIVGFYAIHVVLTIVLLGFLFFLFGCNTKNLEDVDYGPAVPVEQKDKTIQDALGKRTILDAKTAEWVLAQFTQRAYTGAPVETGLSGLQIHSIEEHEDYWSVKVITNEVSQSESGQKEENKYLDEYEVEKVTRVQWPKSTTRDAHYFPAENPYEDIGFSPCAQVSADRKLAPGYSVSYHNLKDEVVKTEPPQLVKDQANCGAVPECSINVHKISYDEIIRNDIGGKLRYHCSFDVSQDVPYLANVMGKCITFLAKSGGKQVPVDLCMNVVNFTFGTKQTTK